MLILVALSGALLTATPAKAPKRYYDPHSGRTVAVPPPLIRTIPTPPQRDATTIIGEWSYAAKSNFYDSWTKNDAQSQLGMACGKTCILYYATTNVTCNKGEVYPALIAGPQGVVSYNMRCYILNDRYVYALDFTGNIAGMFKTDGEMGIAMALDSGKFSVSRFSLSGAAAAMKAVIDAASAADDGKATADFTI